MIAAGFSHLECAAAGERLTPYHLQAEIAATHISTQRHQDTPWARILELYDLLYDLQPTPVIALNRAIALGKAQGAAAGLAALQSMPLDESLERYPFLPTACGEFLRTLGREQEALSCFTRALELARTQPEQRFLERKLAQLRPRAERDPLS